MNGAGGERAAGRGMVEALAAGRVPLASRPGAGVIERELLAENGPVKRVFPSISGSAAKDVIHCCAKRRREGRSGESEEKARWEGDPFPAGAGIFDNLGWKHALS